MQIIKGNKQEKRKENKREKENNAKTRTTNKLYLLEVNKVSYVCFVLFYFLFLKCVFRKRLKKRKNKKIHNLERRLKIFNLSHLFYICFNNFAYLMVVTNNACQARVRHSNLNSRKR